MASSTKRFLSIIGTIAALTAAAIVFSNFIKPEFGGPGSLKQLRIDRNAAIATSTLANAQVDAFNNLAKQYQESSQYKEDLDKSLPSGDNIPSVLEQFQGLAASDKVVLSGVTFQHPPLQAGASSVVNAYGILRTSLRGEGAYIDIKNFIQDIENNVRIMDVFSLSLGSSGKKGVYSLELTIDTYYE